MKDVPVVLFETVEQVRPIVNQIDQRVRALLSELVGAPSPGS